MTAVPAARTGAAARASAGRSDDRGAGGANGAGPRAAARAARDLARRLRIFSFQDERNRCRPA
jgi:hypothetical protein